MPQPAPRPVTPPTATFQAVVPTAAQRALTQQRMAQQANPGQYAQAQAQQAQALHLAQQDLQQQKAAADQQYQQTLARQSTAQPATQPVAQHSAKGLSPDVFSHVKGGYGGGQPVTPQQEAEARARLQYATQQASQQTQQQKAAADQQYQQTLARQSTAQPATQPAPVASAPAPPASPETPAPVTTMGQAAASSSGVMGRWESLKQSMAERNNAIQSSSSTRSAMGSRGGDEVATGRPANPASSYASKLSATGNRFAATQGQNTGSGSSASAPPPPAAGERPRGGMEAQGNSGGTPSPASPAPANASSGGASAMGGAKVSSAQSEYETAKMAQQKAREQVNPSANSMGGSSNSGAAGGRPREF